MGSTYAATYGDITYGEILTGSTPAAIWKPISFWLAQSSDMSIIGHLRQAKARSLTIDNNKSGAASFTLAMDQQAAPLIRPWKTALIVQRGTGTEAEWIWSGPVSNVEKGYAAGTLSVSAVGWFDLLLHRLLQTRVIYTNVDAASIVQALLSIANQQYPTYITMGESETTQLRTRTYEVDANIGQEIQALAEIESGYDWYIDPVTRKLNIVARRGIDRPNCRWMFLVEAGGISKSNLRDVVETEDGSTLVNDFYARGKFGTGHRDSLESRDYYGVLFQESLALSDVPDTDVLLAYAGAEIIYRENPRKTYTINPMPHTAPNVPLIFQDYDIGDTTYLTARRGEFSISEQAIRIFGASMTIDDQGVEQVTSLQTSAS